LLTKLSVTEVSVKYDTIIGNVTATQHSSESEPRGRQGRRRAQTRAKLVAAAAVLFARQGVDNTRINEITEGADVGFGSFYNHFESKDAIVQAVLQETIAAQGEAIAAVTADLRDPAQVIAAAHRHFVRLARTDPDWAWLLVRLDASHHVVLSALGPFALRDLRQGIKAGRLHVPNEQVALFAAGGALLAVMRAVLDGHAPKDADVHHAEGILRLLGLPDDEAAEIARRPLPTINATTHGRR
jgi:AcrR family transcriptional regulator